MRVRWCVCVCGLTLIACVSPTEAAAPEAEANYTGEQKVLVDKGT
jgi:hypothetical protein